MDVELREALTRGFAPEPPHRPVSDLVKAGHRAVRRRRIAGAVVAVATAAVIGVGATIVLDGEAGPDRAADTTEPAGPADSGRSTEMPWQDGELVRFTDDGELELGDGVTVLQRIDSPLPAKSGELSVALALEKNGTETWWLLQRYESGGSSGASFHPGGAFASIQDWIDEQVQLRTDPESVGKVDYLDFAPDGSLVSSHGVTILEQRHPIDLHNFVNEPTDRTAAALLQRPDGEKFYVLVRDLDDHVDVQEVAYQNGGPDLDAFLLFAADSFANGDGLR
jgi:hypothetical protein